MTSLDIMQDRPRRARRRESIRETREYKVIYFVTFPLFLMEAAARRLRPTSTQRLPLLEEARGLASATIPMAFMG